MIALPLMIIGVLMAYLSTKTKQPNAIFEMLSGVALIAGLSTLGFCLTLYR